MKLKKLKKHQIKINKKKMNNDKILKIKNKRRQLNLLSFVMETKVKRENRRRGEKISSPLSHCESCHTRLPLASPPLGASNGTVVGRFLPSCDSLCAFKMMRGMMTC